VINKEIYLPLLEEFAKKTERVYFSKEGYGYPHGVFVPYTFERYEQSPLKLFIIGQDTYYWLDPLWKEDPYNGENDNCGGAQVFCRLRDEGKLSEYLDLNSGSSQAVTVKRIMDWGNNAGIFWKYIPKLVYGLREGRFLQEDIDAEKFRHYLSEIGYGNMSSVELESTLIKEEFDDYNPEWYQIIRTESLKLSSISTLIRAYQPKCIFIMSWTAPEDSFDAECELVDKSSCDLAWVYKVKNSDTTIIWTRHPRSLVQNWGGYDGSINKLVEVFEKYCK